MRPEDVPEAWVQVAWNAWALTQDDAAGICMKHALAAVIPAIQAAERERCAVACEGLEVHSTSRRNPGVTRKIKVGPAVAAAIRAIKEKD
jgi:hypothetical protein